jgi:hypothetical protein
MSSCKAGSDVVRGSGSQISAGKSKFCVFWGRGVVTMQLGCFLKCFLSSLKWRFIPNYSLDVLIRDSDVWSMLNVLVFGKSIVWQVSDLAFESCSKRVLPSLVDPSLFPWPTLNILFKDSALLVRQELFWVLPNGEWLILSNISAPAKLSIPFNRPPFEETSIFRL